MHIRNIDLNLLVAFDALYETRSATRSADRLALSQPAVSSMLKRLRYLFRDQLFIRTQHGLLPTSRANELAAPIRDLIVNLEQLIEAEEFDPKSAQDTLTISANDYIQQAVLLPFIKVLRREAPGIKLSIKPAIIENLSESLCRRELDLALTVSEFADDSLERSRLFSERYVCVARLDHPLTAKRMTLNAFCRYDHLIVSPTRGSFSGPTDEALAAQGIKRNVVASLPSFHILLDTLMTDDYLALVPERFLQNRIAEFKLFKPPILIPDFDVIVCWHRITEKNLLLRWIKDLLRETVEQTC